MGESGSMLEPRHEAPNEYWGQSLNQRGETLENWERISNRGRIKPEIEQRELREGSEEGARWAPGHLIKFIFLNPGNLVYSWSEKLSFRSSGSRYVFDEDGSGSHFDPIQIQLGVFGNGAIYNSPATNVLVHLKEMNRLFAYNFNMLVQIIKRATTLQKLGGLNWAKPESRNPGREARPRFDGDKSPNRGRSPRKSGGGVWGGGSVSPSPENFWNFEL